MQKFICWCIFLQLYTWIFFLSSVRGYFPICFLSVNIFLQAHHAWQCFTDGRTDIFLKIYFIWGIFQQIYWMFKYSAMNALWCEYLPPVVVCDDAFHQMHIMVLSWILFSVCGCFSYRFFLCLKNYRCCWELIFFLQMCVCLCIYLPADVCALIWMCVESSQQMSCVWMISYRYFLFVDIFLQMVFMWDYFGVWMFSCICGYLSADLYEISKVSLVQYGFTQALLPLFFVKFHCDVLHSFIHIIPA